MPGNESAHVSPPESVCVLLPRSVPFTSYAETVTGTPPPGVENCACVLSTSDTQGGCCEELNAWIAADKSQCGADECSGPCEPYCACYVSKCKGEPSCP